MRTSWFVLLPLLLQASCSDYPPPREPFTLTWTGAPFVWPSAEVRSMYKSSGKFVSKNMVCTRAVVFMDSVYAVFPRFLDGVPATLVKTPLLCPFCEAAFEPFPSWEAQAEGDCDCLQNAVDLYVDRRDTLWVLDTGVTHSLGTPLRQCAPKAVGYDLLTGRQKYKVDLSGLTTNSSRLQYIVADLDSRDRPFLYVSDAANNAVLVHNVAEDCGYRVVLPEPVSCGCPAGCPDVLYLALAKPKTGGRRLYLTYLCGNQVYSVRSEDLQSGTDHGAVELVPGEKPQKVVIIGTDNRCTIYLRYEGSGDVLAWDVNTDFKEDNLKLVHSGDCCLLATHAVLDPIRNKVRLLESNFLDFLRGTVGVGAVHVFAALN